MNMRVIFVVVLILLKLAIFYLFYFLAIFYLLAQEKPWKQIFNNLLNTIPTRVCPPPSRFDINIWASALAEHPSEDYKMFILDGITNGFDIGNNGTRPTGKQRNLPTNNFQKTKISEWLFKGIKKGYILGPFTEQNNPFPNVVVSPVGAVPKPPNGVRPIHHLSAPRKGSGISVNSTLYEEYKTVKYVSFKEIVEIADSVGVGGYLWAADAADAYLRVPIKRKYWPLVGIKWNGYYFIMTCLPFGLSSSCILYTLFADAIEWVVLHHNNDIFYTKSSDKVIQLMKHYLDDFVGGHNNLKIAYRQFNSLIKWFQILNVPTRDDKCSSPSTQQKILGTLFNTVTQRVYLPADKKELYTSNIKTILKKKRVQKRELQSLNGRLRFAARHIWCGEAFCRALEQRINNTKDGGYTRLNKQIKEDLIWWLSALNKLKTGIPFKYILYPRTFCKYKAWTDAFVTEEEAGIGGYNCFGNYFQYYFDVKKLFKNKKPDINWFEMAAVVVALSIWGSKYRLSSVQIWCDNAPVVGQISKRSAPFRREDLMFLIRELCLNSINTEYHFFIEHIKGEKNKTADALSRFIRQPFQWLPSSERANIDSTATDCSFICNKLVSSYNK